MSFDLSDPRVTKDGKRILIDGIPFRLWAMNKGVSPQVVQKWVSLGESIDQIEVRYTNKKIRKNKRITVEHNNKQMTMREIMALPECLEGLSMRVVRDRILNCKWGIYKAITTPVSLKTRKKVVHHGKVYSSISELARDLKVTPEALRYYATKGFTLEESINKIKSFSKKTFLYKGERHTVGSLVKHPDNVHGINYGCLVDRIHVLKRTPEEALRLPVCISNIEFKVTYKGEKYRSKKELFSRLGLDHRHYVLINGINPNTKEFDDVVDRILSTVK